MASENLSLPLASGTSRVLASTVETDHKRVAFGAKSDLVHKSGHLLVEKGVKMIWT